MKCEERRPSNSFVLRIWWEQEDGGTFWRGWIQHAASGATCYFHRLSDLLTFVEAHTGPLAQAPGAITNKPGKGRNGMG
ncbi:MAG TPA: hypothetical protein G4N97_01445 [Thermoflexia bacterium]|nr:hypothetical protein [Thermoflexia bacterium]